MVSEDFKIAVKMSSKPAWKIAREAGLNPVTLSRLITGYIQPTLDDERVKAVGKILGLPPEKCFTQEVQA